MLRCKNERCAKSVCSPNNTSVRVCKGPSRPQIRLESRRKVVVERGVNRVERGEVELAAELLHGQVRLAVDDGAGGADELAVGVRRVRRGAPAAGQLEGVFAVRGINICLTQMVGSVVRRGHMHTASKGATANAL